MFNVNFYYSVLAKQLSLNESIIKSTLLLNIPM